jgi:hypothetical protein
VNGLVPGLAQRMDVIYGVILSVSLGAFAAAGVPSTLQTSPAPTSIWLLLTFAAFVFAVDSWYLLSLRAETLNLGVDRNRWRIPALVVAMTVTSFLPFQFLARATDAGYWPRSFEPTNFLFTANLASAILSQALFIAVARGEITLSGEVSLAREAAVAAVTRFVSAAVLIGLAVGPLWHAAGHDTFGMSLAAILIWLVARIIEVGFATVVKASAPSEHPPPESPTGSTLASDAPPKADGED